jgi:hypothetical protein
MKLSRRKLAGAMLGSAAAFAQQPAPIPRNADEELAAAREQLRRSSEALQKYKVPMATEPAFTFKA